MRKERWIREIFQQDKSEQYLKNGKKYENAKKKHLIKRNENTQAGNI